MLEDIGQRLDREQGQRHRDAAGHHHAAAHPLRPAHARVAHAFGDLVRQFVQQLLEVEGGLVFQLVEDAVHQRQRIDAGLGLHQGLARARDP